MDAQVGDRIEVTTNTLGVPPRTGEVLERGETTLRVRWDDGHESTFVPTSNCHVVDQDEDASRPTRLTCHIDLELVEDDDECRATATFVTSRGEMQAVGLARRNPVDPQVPMVGEELAIGRALAELGERLVAAASTDLSDPPPQDEHLVG
jgi:hypothetical protein